MEFSTTAIERYKASADASHYLLIPQIYATPKYAGEISEAISKLLKISRSNYGHFWNI